MHRAMGGVRLPRLPSRANSHTRLLPFSTPFLLFPLLMTPLHFTLYLCTLVHLFHAATWPSTLTHSPTSIIGHRGDKVLFPEHSIASYHTAALLGADYVEPDVVLTKDGILVCLHDIGLDRVTDVSSRDEFLARRRNITGWFYGERTNLGKDWFVGDFTLKELKTLRLKQAHVGARLTGVLDHTLEIATFEEYLDKVEEMSRLLGREIGIIPEIKHARYHDEAFGVKHIVEDKVMDVLRRHGYDLTSPRASPRQREMTRVVLQTFEPEVAVYLSSKVTVDVCLLVDTDYTYLTRLGLARARQFATILSPWKGILAPGGIRGYLSSSNVTVDDAEIRQGGGFPDATPLEFTRAVHDAGMRLVVYTLYDSREPTQAQVAKERGRRAELGTLFEVGVDGVFVENVAEAKEIRDEWNVRLELSGKGW